MEDDSSLHSRKKLGIQDISSLIFFLSNNCFIFNDKFYKQIVIDGCAMDNPVNSPVVANLCVEEIKEPAISAPCVARKVWRCYVDDSFCIIKKAFHYILNSLDPHISFTIKPENHGQILFLATLVSCHNGTLCVGVYRKPIYTPTDTKISTPTMTLNIKKALHLWTSLTQQEEEIEILTKSIQPYSPPAILLNLFTISRQEEPIPPWFLLSKNWLVCFSNQWNLSSHTVQLLCIPSVHQRCHRTLNTFAN